MRRTWMAVLIAAGAACNSSKCGPAPSASQGSAPSAPPLASASAPPRADWRERADFDGDGLPDRVEVDFTGGAHCCYRIAVAIRGGPRVALPFELDGGYVGGLDLSRPERFDVVTAPDGRGEIRMEIATSNGEPDPLPLAWVKDHGVRSHRIAVRVDAGGFHVQNLGWRCEAALIVVRRRAWAAWEGLPGDCTIGAVARRLDAVAGSAGSVAPALLGAARRPASVVPLEPAAVGQPRAQLALIGGHVAMLTMAAGAEAEPAELAQAFGEPAARLDGAPNLRVWPGRGLAVRLDAARQPVEVQLFAATDLATFQRDLERR